MNTVTAVRLNNLLDALEGLVHRCEAEECGTAWAPLTDAREAIAVERLIRDLGPLSREAQDFDRALALLEGRK